MNYSLVDPKDPILKSVAEPFDFSNPEIAPLDLAEGLSELMLSYNGLGIAAPQCGIPFRVLVLCGEELIPIFNPKIVDVSEETVLLEEGCLTYPGLVVKVRRPKKIKVRYAEPNGNVVTKIFDGMTARILQHEIDHLDGICFIDRASMIYKEQALKKWKKIKRG